jgi:hypothetical protein
VEDEFDGYSIERPDEVDDDDNQQMGDWKRKPGPLSREGLAAVKRFADEVLSDAEKLGRRLGKGRRDILIAAGLGTKASRKQNRWNIYRTWYFAHHKKPEDSQYA